MSCEKACIAECSCAALARNSRKCLGVSATQLVGAAKLADARNICDARDCPQRATAREERACMPFAIGGFATTAVMAGDTDVNSRPSCAAPNGTAGVDAATAPCPAAAAADCMHMNAWREGQRLDLWVRAEGGPTCLERRIQKSSNTPFADVATWQRTRHVWSGCTSTCATFTRQPARPA